MNAVISGRAGLAVLIEGESLMSLDVDDLETLVPRSPYDLRFLLADANDLVTLENTDREQIAERLDLEHNITCALDMTLIALDSGASMELRAEAVAVLDELLADERVVEALEFTMYAKPLPDAADLIGALFCTEVKTAAARSFFERLDQCQTAIGAAREAWDALPDRLFGDEPSAKALFHDTACREGLFRLLASSYGDKAKVSAFQLEALRNKSISRLQNYREVVQRWCTPIREAVRTDESVPERESDDDYEDTTEALRHSQGRDKRRHREPAEVVLRKVESQKNLIVASMKERDLDRAREIIEELIDYQRRTGKPEHLAKTLCDLAMEAKALGNYALQLELTNRAVEAKPDDAWSWTQHGDALLNTGRLDEAARAYQQADAFGADVVTKTGRAEVLKARGRLVEAEAAFDEVIAAHPEDVVAKNGRAEVLKRQGRLVEAGAAFDEVIAAHPEDVFAKNGRAEVLKARGRLVEAEAAFDEVIAAHPEDVVAMNGRAEVLKAQGRLVEAEAAFDEVIAAHPEDVFAKNGHAEVLKARGRLVEAEAAFDEVIAAHPEDVVAMNGRAEVLKAQGRLVEAEAAFDEVIAAHPENAVAKNGRAEVLKRQGRFNQALDAYEAIAASHPDDLVARNARSCVLSLLGRYDEALRDLPSANPGNEEDWIGYHIRGMTLLRMSNLEAASQVFELGREFCPWGLRKARFISSLALTRIRNRQFSIARDLLDDVGAPDFKSQAQVLRLHALGELNERDGAIAVYTDLKATQRSFSDELREELRRRYIDREGSLHDDEWVHTREVDMFLEAM